MDQFGGLSVSDEDIVAETNSTEDEVVEESSEEEE